MPKYPVIYDMDEIGVNGALEAVGIHYFCSVECRANHSASGQDGESDEYLPGTQCEECGKELAA
jgi:hypothetical protein